MPKVIRITEVKSEYNPDTSIDIDNSGPVLSNFREETMMFEPTIEIHSSSESSNNTADIAPQPSAYKAPWHCGMLYECKICQSQTFELAELKKHLATVHEENNVEDAAISIVSNFHECLICGRGMIHSYSTIRGHLNTHDLSPSLYYEQFKENLERETILLPITDQNLITKLNGKRTLNITHSLQDSNNLGQGSNVILNAWLNRCGFSCQLCSFEANNHGSFKGHLKNTHQMPGKDYITSYGKYATAVVKHTCQLCGCIFDWDRQMIGVHLSRLHNSVSINEYVSTYENSYTDNPILEEKADEQWMNRCVFECKECEVPSQMNTRSKLILHLSATHQMELKEYVEKHKTIFSAVVNSHHSCKLCEKRVRWDRDSIVAHLDKYHGLTAEQYRNEYLTEEDLSQIVNSPKNYSFTPHDTSMDTCPSLKWNDKCSFACRICYQVCKSKSILKWHLQYQHNMKETFYSDHFESKVIDEVTHSCMVCGEDILFDSTTMKKHLQRSHSKMTIDIYKADYHDKYTISSDSVFSDWINNCQYYCKICFTLHIGKDQFRKHISSEHSLNMTSYTESHQSTKYTEKNHICQVPDKKGNLCLKEVRWDSRSITYHLRKHNLSVEDYKSRCMNNYSEALEAIILRDKSHWFDKCTFICRICCKEFSGKQTLSLHMAEEHQISDPDSRALIEMAVNFLLHTCQICFDTPLWEEQTLKHHFESKHNGLSLQEYATENMQNYKQNEACDNKIRNFDSWVNQCIFKCMCCTQDIEFDKKSKLMAHLAWFHKSIRTGYFTTYENETFVKKTEHVCQMCTKKYLWDDISLSKHITGSHKMKLSVYRAKYMSRYTENEEELDRQRKEDSKQSQSSKQKKTAVIEGSSKDDPIELNDDEVWGSSDEVRTWARGCHYHCDICNQDFVGARPFDNHLSKIHDTSMSSNKKKYGSSQICTVRRFHFCRLCFNNVRQDEDDLKNHFQKEHNISVASYYEQFKSKLSMPRLEKPVTTRADIHTQYGPSKVVSTFNPNQPIGNKRSSCPIEVGSSGEKKSRK